jgi:hypothetical protein
MVTDPAATPVTTPEALTVATEVLEEDQDPPVVVSCNVVVEPAQTVVVPVMGFTLGVGFTGPVPDELAEQPAALVTV